jgi:hypothetical protein
LFILVIGVGVLTQLRVQYPPVPATASPETRQTSRATRRMLSRGLGLSSGVGAVFAVVSAAAAHQWLSGLGPALQFIPASVAAVSLMFVVAAWWYRRVR